MSARYNLLAAIRFNDAVNAGSEPEELVDAYRLEAIAERDAQIIEWLLKKAREEGRSNKDSRTRGDVLAQMADKLSRGAVRPPLSKGPDAVDYGIRLSPDAPNNEVLDYRGVPRASAEDRLKQNQVRHPNAQLVQRTVHHGQWTDVATS